MSQKASTHRAGFFESAVSAGSGQHMVETCGDGLGGDVATGGPMTGLHMTTPKHAIENHSQKHSNNVSADLTIIFRCGWFFVLTGAIESRYNLPMETGRRPQIGDTEMTSYTRAQAKAEAADRGVKYRITKDGDVHFYCTMPNTNDVGWYLAGWAV